MVVVGHPAGYYRGLASLPPPILARAANMTRPAKRSWRSSFGLAPCAAFLERWGTMRPSATCSPGEMIDDGSRIGARRSPVVHGHQLRLSKSNLTYVHGADELHLRGSARGFRDGVDITAEVVDGELLPQLRFLVERGQLNEWSSPDLPKELILAKIAEQRRIFGRLLTPDRRAIRYPLRLDAVIECLLREKLARHYDDEIVARKGKGGEVQERWTGTTVGYSY